MRDLDIAKSVLKKNNAALVIVKNGRIVYETNSPGIRGLIRAIEKVGKEIKGATVADKIVGEAAAQIYAYLEVIEVSALTLSQCGKRVLEKNNIHCEYEKLVPHILNFTKTDLCPFEKLVKECKSPKEAYDRVKLKISSGQEPA